MGKVFTSQELEHGQYPAPGAHLEAAQFLMDELFVGQGNSFSNSESTLWSESGIASGMIYGSSIHGTSNIRSDLDVLAIIEPSLGDPFEILHDAFAHVKKSFKTPIEANVITFGDAINGNHTIDPLFYRYLQRVQANATFSYNSPLSGIYGLTLPEGSDSRLYQARVVHRYLSVKSSSFAKALALDDELDYHRLQRALEVPKNIGRKVISLYDPSFDIQSASARMILDRLNEFLYFHSYSEKEQAKTIATLSEVAQLDEEYTDTVIDVVSGDLSPEDHDRWIELSAREIIRLAFGACINISQAIEHYVNLCKNRTSYTSDQSYETAPVLDDHGY